MTRPSFSNGLRRGPRFGAAVAAVALGVALIVPGVANAAAPVKWTSNVQFQYGNGYCGAGHPELSILGDLTATKAGGKVTLHVMLDGAPATGDATYNLYLYDGGSCSQIAYLGDVVTDAYGVADVTFTAPTKGAKTLFATLYGGNGWNDTTIFPVN